jgi:DNA-binding CsgD family transcriptional regulator
MLQGASIAAGGLPSPRFSMAAVARTSPAASEPDDEASHPRVTAAGAAAVDGLPVPHWRHAAGHHIEQLQQGVAAILTRSDAALAVLDFVPFGIILVDCDSTALLVNRRAERVLGEQDGFDTQGGKLVAARPTDTTRLRQSIARTWRLAHGPGPHPSDGFQLARPSGRRPLVIRIVPLQPRIDALAVVVCDPETRTAVEQRLLHQLYRLTRTEAQLVAALADGERLEDAAQALGVTLGTGRTYLKRVFAKMGVSRQTDLMRLLLSGPTQFCSD